MANTAEKHAVICEISRIELDIEEISLMSFECGFCVAEYDSRESLQDHLETCKKEFVKIEVEPNDPEKEESPIDKPLSDSERIYICGHCGANYTLKERLIIHRATCP